MKNVLVTGAAGYIGSHTCLELLEQRYSVIGFDNLVNSNRVSIKRVQEVTQKKISFYEIDLRDYDALDKIFETENIDAVIHFSGYKAVGESVEKPLLYYSNNVEGSIVLLKTMEKHDVSNIVFSSSCTVYGKSEQVPVNESAALAPNNPYGRSKLIVENILKDTFQARDYFSVSVLRYFNPIGAHPSGRIGEDPSGIPNNLLPYVSKVAAGKLNKLRVFGNDYSTHDGTGVRDYIHVVDLAKAHIFALEELFNHNQLFEIYNLGTGQGYSVLDIVKAFEEASGREVAYEIVQRRPGDVDKTYSDPTKANKKLGWVAEKNIEDMCADMWNWQLNNPDGY